MLNYERKQDTYDKERKIVRVSGVIFGENESDETINKVMHDILTMPTLVPGLMSAQGLYNSMKCYDKYVLERMVQMPIGSHFNYEGRTITRHSEFTYNAKYI